MVEPSWGRHKRALLGATLTALLYAGMAGLVTGPADTPVFLAGYALAWILYLWVLGSDANLRPELVLLWSLLARLLWVGSEPWLSDDLFRYLLDGRVLAAGLNPFQYAPAHPTIQALAPDLASRVNHPGIPTIYPTVVQLVGGFAALLHLGVVGWRVLLSLCDLALVASIAALFGGGRDGWRAAAVYGLCPLAILESGANGHVEPLVLLPLSLALGSDRRAWTAGLFLGVAALAKYFPLLLGPLWLRRRSGWTIPLLAMTAVFVGMLPFTMGGIDVTLGLRAYLENWNFNGPLHALFRFAFGDARWLRLIPFVAAAVGAAIALWRRVPPRSAAAPLFFVFLLFGPTLHPWYALWVLPWLGPRPSWTLWAFVAAVGLGYAVWWQQHVAGQWTLPLWQSLGIWSIVALAWLTPRVLRLRGR